MARIVVVLTDIQTQGTVNKIMKTVLTTTFVILAI
jgi:hypothetical protein